LGKWLAGGLTGSCSTHPKKTGDFRVACFFSLKFVLRQFRYIFLRSIKLRPFPVDINTSQVFGARCDEV
jgi:hypothetical protein